MSFHTEAKTIEQDKTTKTPEETSSSEQESSTTSENSAPLSKRLIQKKTTPTIIAESTGKSIRNRQSSLPKALENPVLIKTIDMSKQESQKKKSVQHRVTNRYDANRGKAEPQSPIQEMGLTDKSPEFQACVKFIEAI